MDNSNDINSIVDSLKKDNEDLKAWQSEASKLMQMLTDKAQSNEQKIADIKQTAYINRIRIESMPFEMRDPAFRSSVFIPHILSPAETIDMLSSGKSFGRFEEAEFKAIADKDDPLSEKLKAILQSSEDDFLIGLNRLYYVNLESTDSKKADSIREYMRPDTRKFHASLLDRDKIYGNALLSDMDDNDVCTALMNLWNDKDCVFIALEGNDFSDESGLFNDCRNMTRILCSHEDVTKGYEDILGAVTEEPKEKLVLISLGPVGTVLAHDLYKIGYRAIDIGSL